MYYTGMKVLIGELSAFARSVLTQLPHKDVAVVVALCGTLGAGKTTFAQALARELGVASVVQSPTYVLMKKYQTAHEYFTTLVHIDAYRLEKPEEFRALRPEQFLHDARTLVLVEWPEMVGTLLPKPDLTITFSAEGARERERDIEIT